jgi:polyisoprenoid-binding protein YceI
MKKLFHLFTLLTFSIVAACGGGDSNAVSTSDATQEAASASAGAVTYTVDVANSIIEWVGYKPGKYAHNGIIKLQSGQLSLNNGKPESGNFVIDMNSLADMELTDPAKKAKLENHLKSGDFFEVEKYPTGTFDITAAEAIAPDSTGANFKVAGNLTLKGIAKSIQIPAKVALNNGMVTVETPEFAINRTEWGVQYKSGILGTLKDEIIADDVKLKIKLTAKAAIQ